MKVMRGGKPKWELLDNSIELMLMLQRKNGVSYYEIMSEFNVSLRTAQRMINRVVNSRYVFAEDLGRDADNRQRWRIEVKSLKNVIGVDISDFDAIDKYKSTAQQLRKRKVPYELKQMYDKFIGKVGNYE